MSAEVEIRRAASVADYLACQGRSSRRAWGIADESYVVPLATLVGANLRTVAWSSARSRSRARRSRPLLRLPGEGRGPTLSLFAAFHRRRTRPAGQWGFRRPAQASARAANSPLVRESPAWPGHSTRSRPATGAVPTSIVLGATASSIHRGHVRPEDRRPQRRGRHRPTDRRVGHRLRPASLDDRGLLGIAPAHRSPRARRRAPRAGRSPRKSLPTSRSPLLEIPDERGLDPPERRPGLAEAWGPPCGQAFTEGFAAGCTGQRASSETTPRDDRGAITS